MRRRLIVLALALALVGGATIAMAARGEPLYRTDRQAELYLLHGLRRWDDLDLRKAYLKAAFCTKGYGSKGKQGPEVGYPRRGINRLVEQLFRSFACTLSLQVRSPKVRDPDVYGPRVFYLHLVTTGTGWRVEADA
jgi:hypothetical protein